MRTSRKYRVSPAAISDLSAAVIANGGASRGAVIHTVDPDHHGDYLIQVVGATDQQYFEDVCKMAYLAEQGKAVLLPVRNKNSKHIGNKGDSLEFDGVLYHIGAWTNPQYGVQYIHRFQAIDHNDSEVTWITNKIQPLGRYDVICRVKDHTNYSGVYQTAVTHCRFNTEE